MRGFELEALRRTARVLGLEGARFGAINVLEFCASCTLGVRGCGLRALHVTEGPGFKNVFTHLQPSA